MNLPGWIQEFPGAITVCDAEGVILSMNDQAIEAFRDQGGQDLIGRNVLDCHPEPSRSKLKAILQSRQPNVYTTEKKGIRRLIYQSPWYQNGQYAGIVELALRIPAQMPHFVRDAS